MCLYWCTSHSVLTAYPLDTCMYSTAHHCCTVQRVSTVLKLHLILLPPSAHTPSSESLVRLSTALKNNPQTVLTYLDLSDNAIDDKCKRLRNLSFLQILIYDPPPPAMESRGGALESLPHGLHHLKLANCKISTRGKWFNYQQHAYMWRSDHSMLSMIWF